MTVSFALSRASGRGGALSPHLGAILALAIFFALGAGAKDAYAAICISGPSCLPPPPPVTQDFAFSFYGSLAGGGSISGGGILVTQQQSPGEYLVTNVLDGALNYVPSLAEDPIYSLTYVSPGTYLNNDNLLFPYSYPQLDPQGISFNVGNGAGYLNLSDPPGNNYTFDIGGATFNGPVNFQVTPGPTPGTGLLGFAFLILAGAAARARGLVAR
jgi:hypothetical protein